MQQRLEYRLQFITDQPRLLALAEHLASVPAFALDIETINWWNRQAEKVALMQLAYRGSVQEEVRVAIIDTLASLDPSILRRPLAEKSTVKVIHNASFDAVKLARHFKIATHPIHDTQLAARRSGEKRYSLKAQAEKHLHLTLNKDAQQSDWSVRPLSARQLDYAALDAVATLLLYEHQLGRGLTGEYRLRAERTDEQVALPLDAVHPQGSQIGKPAPETSEAFEAAVALPLPVEVLPRVSKERDSVALSASSLALLGIITELPSRYSPQQLAVSVGDVRVGLAGWIIDRTLGEDADIDESSAKEIIAELIESGLVGITPTRRLEASNSGRAMWLKHKFL